MHHDFRWLLIAKKLLTVKPHSRYVRKSESESENFVSLESEFDILTPTPQLCSASIHRGRIKTTHVLSCGLVYFPQKKKVSNRNSAAADAGPLRRGAQYSEISQVGLKLVLIQTYYGLMDCSGNSRGFSLWRLLNSCINYDYEFSILHSYFRY